MSVLCKWSAAIDGAQQRRVHAMQTPTPSSACCPVALQLETWDLGPKG